MLTIADASDMAVWDLRTWVFVAVAVCILGPVLLLIALAHGKRDHQRRADRGANSQLRSARSCSVQTCPQDGECSINGWRLCVDHMLIIGGRKL